MSVEPIEATRPTELFLVSCHFKASDGQFYSRSAQNFRAAPGYKAQSIGHWVVSTHRTVAGKYEFTEDGEFPNLESAIKEMTGS